MNKPVEGETYWVTDGKEVWVADCYSWAAGGWTNGDTWEDFTGKIIGWLHIPRPEVEDIMAEVDRE